MQFGIFYEHQIPRPWQAGDEQRLFHNALDQVALADQLGIDYVWAVEHHFLEEYSHSSAVTGFMCHEDSQTAVDQGWEGFQFFGHALSYYYIHGTHQPGQFDLWADF